MQISVLFKKTKYTLLKSTYDFKTPAKQMLVFFRESLLLQESTTLSFLKETKEATTLI